MLKTAKNRQLILEFYQLINGSQKTAEMIRSYTSDQSLIDHILFFEKLFPRYRFLIHEITSEGARVIVKGIQKGRQEKPGTAIPFSTKTVEIPFAIGFQIQKGKILNHWLITDQIALLEQLELIYK